MDKKVKSKKISKHLRLQLTTYGPDRGAMIELIDLENPEYGLDEALFEAHYWHPETAIEQYRELKTKSQAIHWAYINS